MDNAVWIIIAGIVAVAGFLVWRKAKNKVQFESERPIQQAEPLPNQQPDFFEYEVDGRKIFEIHPFEIPQTNIFKTQPIASTKPLKIVFDSVLSQLPDLTNNVSNLKSLKIIFPPEISKGIGDGAYQLMKGKTGNIHAIAIDAKTKNIKSIASIQSKINPTTAAMIAWQAAAMITAQKFLSDINKKLQNIEHSIHEIKRYFEHGQEAEVKTYLEYLQNHASIIADDILNYEQLLTYNNMLQNIDLQCHRISNELLLELEYKTAELKNANLMVTNIPIFGDSLDETTQKIQNGIEQIQKKFELLILIQSIRIYNAQLISYIPEKNRYLSVTIAAINDKIVESETLRRNFAKTYALKISELKGRFNSKATDQSHQKEIIEKLSQFQSNLIPMEARTNRQNRDFKIQLEEKEILHSGSQEFYIELDQERQIKRIEKILPDS